MKHQLDTSLFSARICNQL